MTREGRQNWIKIQNINLWNRCSNLNIVTKPWLDFLFFIYKMTLWISVPSEAKLTYREDTEKWGEFSPFPTSHSIPKPLLPPGHLHFPSVLSLCPATWGG